MNNDYMLTIIEQKMCSRDRKVWSRQVKRKERGRQRKNDDIADC